MKNLNALKKITTKRELAALLNFSTKNLTFILYKLGPNTQYHQFEIKKKNGGTRVISAPYPKLKKLQSNLSKLLQDCLDEINSSKYPDTKIKRSNLAHGFMRERSIITNAMMHINKKNVLNIDLSDFFDSINFGRVRGFFIKNREFQLHPDIATIIAQIACYQNKLPQGSPCSPVITNLVTHSLDIRLAALAKRYSCTYSRYADDITFSTRELVFPNKIMRLEKDGYIAGKKLRNEILRSGFSINDKKTRIQHLYSRQDVTGLVVNKKPNIKKEYWRLVKAQCHLLFKTGSFITKTEEDNLEGNINELEGKLNFIDQISLFNRLRERKKTNPLNVLNGSNMDKSSLLSGKEKVFSRFLFYRLFFGNQKPTIICEGHTDNIHLKSAIHMLVKKFPQLAKLKSQKYELLLRFLEYTNRTRFLLELSGGTGYICHFINNYNKKYNFYGAVPSEHPVIIVLDNDSGFNEIKHVLKNLKAIPYPAGVTVTNADDFRNSSFIHVVNNLYIVLTPLNSKGEFTDTEALHEDKTRLIKYKDKHFNTITNRDQQNDLSKDSFAKSVVKLNKSSINFDGFIPLLKRIEEVLIHHSKL